MQENTISKELQIVYSSSTVLHGKIKADFWPEFGDFDFLEDFVFDVGSDFWRIFGDLLESF